MGILGINLGEFAKDIADAIDTVISKDPENVAARQEGRTERTEARQEGKSDRQGARQETRSIRSMQGNSFNDLAMRHSDNVTGLLGEALPYAAAAAAAALGGPLGAAGALGGLGGGGAAAGATPSDPTAPSAGMSQYLLPLGMALAIGAVALTGRK